jgi:NAD(P)-dependent dehydrogenase (short-subunit alcohol dehydrogenase family)
MQLEGRTALVTGTSRGIGPAIVRALRGEGARVLCHARTMEAADAAARDLGGEPGAGDLGDEPGIADVAAQVRALAPELHVLVHNAGILERGSIDDATRADLEACFAVNVLAPIGLTQALLGPLRAADRARVVVVSSTMGQFSGGMTGGSLPYRVSKAAVNAFVACTATELAADSILVNAMHPGWVKTAMGGAAAPVTPEEAAVTALHLATLPDGAPSGRFWRDCAEIPW